MSKNKLIEKWLNLDIDIKATIINSNADNYDSAYKLFNLISNKKWIHQYALFNSKDEYFKFKSCYFVENNFDDIILGSYSLTGSNGIYIDPNEEFAIAFQSYNDNGANNQFIYYAPIEHRDKLLTFVYDNIEPIRFKKNVDMSLLLQDKHGDYFLRKYPVKPIIDLNIGENYNDDFDKIHNKLFYTLSTTDKSLNILHGLPGTGKTTYIKYLCYELANLGKEIVYLSPSVTSMLSSPAFISNLSLFKDKIVIIEDAEDVLVKSNNRSQAITNILNITDGILADIYNIHFIFTFNMDIRQIDEALLRKGRLTLKYEFKELSNEKTAKLATKLGVKIPNKCTLAEIYNEAETGVEVKNTAKLGF